ncbi:MAG TPA: hypothetical protein PKY87_14905 [Terricaulis sp.]|nr:hypothetical protein [Terricaulis sp.]
MSAERDIIFEIVRIGDAQRVAAVDVATGVEVVVMAPASAAIEDVQALALRKLERALAGEASGGEGGPKPPPGRGKLV